MRLLICLSVLTLSSALPQQGGFFSGISGALNNFFGGNPNAGRRPPPPARRPVQQQFQQPAAPAFQPQPPQFQQPQQFQPQQFQQPQVQQFQPPQPVAQPAPAFRPQPQPQIVQSAPLRQPVDPPQQQVVTGGTSLCGAQAPNHFWTDPRDGVRRGYVVTWKFGCSSFQQSEARAYCESMGMSPVSLDSPAKQRTVFWANPSGTPVPFDQSRHWSHTGGAGLPQPDNRAAGEVPPHQETCLGVLNNFYADGIKWHDVACHHKKPTVCEPRS